MNIDKVPGTVIGAQFIMLNKRHALSSWRLNLVWRHKLNPQANMKVYGDFTQCIPGRTHLNEHKRKLEVTLKLRSAIVS